MARPASCYHPAERGPGSVCKSPQGVRRDAQKCQGWQVKLSTIWPSPDSPDVFCKPRVHVWLMPLFPSACSGLLLTYVSVFNHKILFKFFFLQEAAFPVRGSHGGKMPKAQTTKAQLDKGDYSKVTRSGTANQSEKVCKMECL